MKDETLYSLLIQRQLLTSEEGNRARIRMEQSGCMLEEALIELGILSVDQLLKILENHYFCPALRLNNLKYDALALSIIPRKMAERHVAFPVEWNGEVLQVAFAQPDNRRSIEDIRILTNKTVKPVVALEYEIRNAIEQHYQKLDAEMSASESTARERVTAGFSPSRELALSAKQYNLRLMGLDGKEPSALVDSIIRTAYENEVADIHYEPGENAYKVRFRLDGLLHEVASLPMELVPSVTSRIKILSGMDITERRLPQDGRFTVRFNKDAVDLRVSCLPSQYGEKLVMRLLTKRAELMILDNLSMPAPVRQDYDAAICNPQGFFLVTGPTGSGKTTTLYATLNALDKATTNIVTLEDPIEYSLDGITQVQIHEEIGLTFAAGLRSILRQDPDVILIGEIRDVETVEIACRAALTGHKVFSTLHTNDACQAITRLIDMGVPPYLIAATLSGVLAQRLVRRICKECTESYAPNETELAALGHPHVDSLHRGRGCAHCSGTGYRGRMAIYEFLRFEENLHRLIIERASPYAIRHAAQRQGMLLMTDFAKRAVLEGLTTVAEIQRAILIDDGKEQMCLNCKRVVSIEYSVCPFCQHVLKEKCAHCGSPVESSWEACANCGQEIEREWQKLYCRHCLAPVSPHWDTCHYCGGMLHHHGEDMKSGKTVMHQTYGGKA